MSAVPTTTVPVSIGALTASLARALTDSDAPFSEQLQVL
jgi:hypothetical protein